MTESNAPHPDDHPQQWDAIVVGGGPAGLSAALMLGRSRRRVLVVDAGEPRNRFAAHMHGVLGHEGLEPAELLRRGREEVRGYGVEIRSGSVTGVDDDEAGLTVRFADAPPAHARSLVLAAGQTDALPDIPGLREFWGTSVLHCPYCHGWEVRGRRLAVLGTSPMSLHQVQLVRQWSDDLVFLTAEIDGPDADLTERLRARDVVLEDTPVEQVLSEGDTLRGIRLADGRELNLDAIFVASGARPHDDVVAGLHLEQTTTPMGTVPDTDQTGRTSHPRVWAVGNVANPGATVPVSMAAGAMAGSMVNMMLIEEEFDAALDACTPGAATLTQNAADTAVGADTAADAQPAAYWEGQYAGRSRRWSGAANATTAAVASTLTVGDALELGSGEGGDAVWLAEQGWRVTAVDISPTAVARGAQAATERGVDDRINWVSHDLATWRTDERFDLVTASFFHSNVDLPRVEILRRAAEQIRSDGHLLLVTHVFESEADIPPWADPPAADNDSGQCQGHTEHHGHRGHDGHHAPATHRGSHHSLPTPTEDLVALALDPGEWEVVLEEIRPREATSPDGTQTATLKDGVLLLRRRG